MHKQVQGGSQGEGLFSGHAFAWSVLSVPSSDIWLTFLVYSSAFNVCRWREHFENVDWSVRAAIPIRVGEESGAISGHRWIISRFVPTCLC